ncbi:MAG: hypothetical protein AAGG55_04925 [Pseudomonadota bacterium]
MALIFGVADTTVVFGLAAAFAIVLAIAIAITAEKTFGITRCPP